MTEYVLNAGDPLDRVRRFAKRPARAGRSRRAPAAARRSPPPCSARRSCFTGDLEAARAHLLEAARLSREVGAVGGESLARTRLGEALLQLGDRAGARRAARGGARARARLAARPPSAVPRLRVLVRVARRDATRRWRWSTAPRRCSTRRRPASSARPSTTSRRRRLRARAGGPSAPRLPGRGPSVGARWDRWAALGRAWPRRAASCCAPRASGARAAVAFRRAAEGYAVVGHRLHEDRVRDRWPCTPSAGRREGRGKVARAWCAP